MTTERELLQQLFLLKCDIEACPMLDAFAATQRNRWAARLGDLLNRRHASLDAECRRLAAADDGEINILLAKHPKKAKRIVSGG